MGNSNIRVIKIYTIINKYIIISKILDDALKLTVDLIFPHNDVKFEMNSNWDRLRK